MPASSNCFWYSLINHVRVECILWPASTKTCLVNFLEDVLDPAIVFLQDGVLGGQELATPVKTDIKGESKGRRTSGN